VVEDVDELRDRDDVGVNSGHLSDFEAHDAEDSESYQVAV
jgi:hypothetical protein